MSSLSTLKPTDRSRTAQELNDLTLCSECDAELVPYWWTLRKGSVSLRKRCDACGQTYGYIIYNYEEAEQITFK